MGVLLNFLGRDEPRLEYETWKMRLKSWGEYCALSALSRQFPGFEASLSALRKSFFATPSPLPKRQGDGDPESGKGGEMEPENQPKRIAFNKGIHFST
jgi:hypothetical protein